MDHDHQNSSARTPEPRSIQEVKTIALAVNRAAESRYAAAARVLRDLGPRQLAALLEELGNDHRARREWLEGDLKDAAAQDIAPEDLALHLPQLYSDAGDWDFLDLTEYRVFAFAVDLAQQAFKLYSYLAASADREVSAYAERLAGEELARAARLRVRRRRAYHRERRQPRTDIYPIASRVESLADLLSAAQSIEERLARNLADARERHPGLSSVYEAARGRAMDLRQASEQAGGTSGPMADDVARFSQAMPKDPLQDHELMAECQRAFTFYDAVASAPADEAVMLLSHDLSEAAVERIRQVRLVDAPRGQDSA